MTDKLYLIIPAYNEQANIASVAREWHSVAVSAGKDSRLVIIDDGSKDDTFAKMQTLQKELPQLKAITKPNGGHGATLCFGYAYALEHHADYIFQTDSDGQTLPSEFEIFWQNRKRYDIQIGVRKGRQDGFSRVFVTKTLRLILFLQFGMWITDANTPFRLMTASSLRQLFPKIPSNHNLSNVLLTVLYHKYKKSIQYHPITFRPRQGGINSINFKKITRIGLQAVKDFASLRKSL